MWIVDNWQTILNAVAYIVAGASLLVKLTPSTWDDNIIAKILQFLALTKKPAADQPKQKDQ